MGAIGVALLVLGAGLLTTSTSSSLSNHLKKRAEYFRKKVEEAEREQNEKLKDNDQIE